MKNICVLSNKLYAPTDTYFPYVLDNFMYKLASLDKSACDHCFAEYCDDCPVANQDPYVRTYEHWGRWTAFQRGDLQKLWQYFGNADFQIIDQRARNAFEYPLSFTGRNGGGLTELWENQLEALNQWWKFRYGIIKAPVRSGKTVIMSAMSMLIKQKTLLLCHTEDLLKQFLDTFEQFTNVIELRRAYKKPIIGICKEIGKWQDYDVVLCTPHSIYSKKGRAQVADWRDYFGNTMADECFSGDTLVLTDYGKAVPIRDICQNDQIKEVLAYDLDAKQIVRKQILRKIVNKSKSSYTTIWVGDHKIQSTYNHKFYVVNRGYVQAQDVRVGDELITYFNPDVSRIRVCDVCGKDFLYTNNASNINNHRMKEHIRVTCPVCGETNVSPYHVSQCKGVLTLNADPSIKTRATEAMLHTLYHTEQGEIARQVNSDSKKGDRNPVHQPGVLQRITDSLKKTFHAKSEDEKMEQIIRFRKAGNRSAIPTKQELLLDAQGIPNLRYTGQAEYWIRLTTKRVKNPDFIYLPSDEDIGEYQTSKVIEIMDFEYWHTKEEAQELIDLYKQVGVECLVLDSSRVESELTNTIGIVNAFINNHYLKVTQVVTETRSGQPGLNYNLEVEDTHNYFVLATRSGNDRMTLSASALAKDVAMGAFSPILVSNCHRTAAHAYCGVINSFNPLFRLGCTATDLRKDEMEVTMYDTFGPVVVEMESNQLPCDVHVWHTPYYVANFRNFVTYQNRLTKDADRNRFIVERIIERLEQGHSILVTTIRREHIDTLVRMIDGAGYTAAPFYDGVNRDKVLKGARDGSIQVVVGMRQMVREGINVPRWSNVHVTIPIGFKDSALQEYSRCRTRILDTDNVVDGPGSLKIRGRNPVIDYYYDKGGPSPAMYKIIEKSWTEQEGFTVIHHGGASMTAGANKHSGRLRY